MISRYAILALALALASCSDKPAPQVGGESHWLAACSADPDCADPELSCVCGTCTRACSRDAMCGGGRKAACFDPDSPLLLQRCEQRGTDGAGGVCLLSCRKDGECGDARACKEGACVPGVPVATSDGGIADAGATDPPTSAPSTHDFDAVSPAVSWSQPVTVPKPATTVAGADDRILGTWQETRCDEAHTEDDGEWSCARLVLERGPSGEVTGTFDIRFAGFDSDNQVAGPFAAAQDPDVGWPTELAVTDYFKLALNVATDVRYRMLDGRFEGDTLTFSWSIYDPWHEWCALQQSFRWEVDGHGFHFCVPQGEAAQAGIDEGKIVLCTSADFEPICFDGIERVPCVCQGESPLLNPRCSPAYCQCDDAGCDARVVQSVRARLVLSGEQLVGTWADDGPRSPISLVRVKP